jgi:hypothetical protein
MSSRSNRLSTGLGAVALVVITASGAWAQKSITCESDGGYKFCPVDTYGRAILVRDTSNGICVAGTNWAYDRHGVWVDKGCKGEFEVNDAWPGGKPGGLVKPDPDPKAKVPGWAVGTFKGTVADWGNAPFEITVGADGVATLAMDGQQFYGRFIDGLVRVPGPGSMTFEMKKVGEGVQVTSLTNREHRIVQLARAGS